MRTRTQTLRRITGGILVVTSVAIWFGVADQAQRLVPGYVAEVQARIEDNDSARRALGGLSSDERAAAPPSDSGSVLSFDDCERDPAVLADCGPARPFVGISAWLNTAEGRPLTIEGLQGRVVLVDFWTYSCINCQRTLPYLTAWDARYRDLGLTIVGVHSPEFAFEHDIGNVTDQAAALGVRYPVAIDNDFRTWREYDQRYWPAHYLIDRTGRVRQVHYGEGAYAETEALIRQLLGEGAGGPQGSPGTPLMPEPVVPTATPQAAPAIRRTPETYLGYGRAAAYANADLARDTSHTYQAPAVLEPDRVALDGSWRLESERITAGQQARLLLHYRAAKVFLVLGGTGTVQAAVAGSPPRTVQVSGAPTLYQIVDGPPRRDAGPGGHPRGLRIRLHLRLGEDQSQRAPLELTACCRSPHSRRNGRQRCPYCKPEHRPEPGRIACPGARLRDHLVDQHDQQRTGGEPAQGRLELRADRTGQDVARRRCQRTGHGDRGPERQDPPPRDTGFAHLGRRSDRLRQVRQEHSGQESDAYPWPDPHPYAQHHLLGYAVQERAQGQPAPGIRR